MTISTIRDPREMRARAGELRREGRRIALVPTMGYLHAGHLSLVGEARRRGDVVVVSIYVNPTQFGPSEDLARYPSDLPGDLDKAQGAGADIAFAPETLYGPDHQTFVDVRRLSQGLCGDRRPGHFTGVATIVSKLFNLVQPHVAVFGEKDFQQLAVIRQLVKDLDYDVEIVGMPIVREPDGLAMSSRNAYLGAGERPLALSLSHALARAEEAFRAGERDAGKLVAAARAAFPPAVGVDYVELRDAASLVPLETVERPAVMALAAFVGKTRLIDNRVLTPPSRCS